MSQSLSQVDQTIFDEQVKKEYQSAGFLLRNAVRLRTNVQATTVSFRKVGTVTAEQYAFQSAVVYQDPGYNKVDVNLVPYRAPTLIDDLQQFLYNFDERKEDAQLVAMALGRRSDQLIIDALNSSGTTNVIAHGGVGMTFAKIAEAAAIFDSLNVPVADRHLALSAKAAADLMAEEKFTSSLYLNIDLVKSGNLNGNFALGFNFHVVGNMNEGGLPLNGTTRSNFAWHSKAIGMATGKDFTTIIERVPHLDSWQVLAKMYAGAVAVDNKGIVEIQTTESV